MENIIAGALGGATVNTLIFYSLAVIAVYGSKRKRMATSRIFAGFLIALFVFTALNVAYALYLPSTGNGANEYLGLFQTIVIPAFVSIATVLVIWKPASQM